MENNENSELKVYVLYPNIQKEELNNIKIIRIKDNLPREGFFLIISISHT